MQKPSILDESINVYLDKFMRYNSMMEDFLISEFLDKKKNWNLNNLIVEGKFKNKESELKFLQLSREASEQIIFYPQSFRTSLLVQLFSILEHELKLICLYHHNQVKTDFSITDLSGNSDLEKAKKYLTNSCKVDFANLNPEWNFLSTIRKIRNIIVHHKAEINQTHTDWKSIFNFVMEHKDKIGFSEYIEYTTKDDFKKYYEPDYPLNIEIRNYKLNGILIEQIGLFLLKLKSELKLV